MLHGIIIKPIKRSNDERGSFAELYRQDWKDLFQEGSPVQANLSTTYPAVIRAWHRHTRGQTDYFIVLRGAAKICAYDEKTEALDEIISTGSDMQVVRMPGHYWHGFKALGKDVVYLLYFATQTYDYGNPDEERRPWNDKTIIPKTINGDKKDPRNGRPWDWNYSPNK